MADVGVDEDRAVVTMVLIVDNDPVYAGRLREMVEDVGFRVAMAADGGQAQSAITMKKPDFIILDLILPGASGFEVCERIKQNPDAPPVLIHTAVDLDEARDLAAEVGADGFIAKPLQPEEVETLIRNVAQIVKDRKRGAGENVDYDARIEFACRCGKRFSVSFKNRGKSMTCPNCHEPVRVPKIIQSLQDNEAFSKRHAGDHVDSSEPLNFVSIKCQHCGTNYRMQPHELEKARTCPKCEKEQVGALLIAGIPLTRAALVSSRRVLTILSGKRRGKKLLLPNQNVVIGSDVSCMLRIPSEHVEPRNTLLKPTPHGIIVRDLGSRGGTWVNDVRIAEETLLEPGDKLRVGSLILRLAGTKQTELDRAIAGDESVEQNGVDEEAVAEAEADEKSARGLKKIAKQLTTAELGATIIQKHWEAVNVKEHSV